MAVKKKASRARKRPSPYLADAASTDVSTVTSWWDEFRSLATWEQVLCWVAIGALFFLVLK